VRKKDKPDAPQLAAGSIHFSQTSPNTAYTAHFVRTNFGYAETSYILETLSEMFKKERYYDIN